MSLSDTKAEESVRSSETIEVVERLDKTSEEKVGEKTRREPRKHKSPLVFLPFVVSPLSRQFLPLVVFVTAGVSRIEGERVGTYSAS